MILHACEAAAAGASPDDNAALQQTLVLLRDATTGEAAPPAKLAADAPFAAALAALDTLGLVPGGQPPGTHVPPAVRGRIRGNAGAAQRALRWSDKTVAVATVRAAEVWHVERLVASEAGAAAAAPPAAGGTAPATAATVTAAVAAAGLTAGALEEVAGMVDALGSIAAAAAGRTSEHGQAHDGARLEPKLAGYVVATASRGPPRVPLAAPTSFETVRAAQAWAAAAVCDPASDAAPSLTALVGICASRASCADSSTVLWLTWIKMVRSLIATAATADAARSHAALRCVAHACVAPFSPSGGPCVLGERAALALSVVARNDSVYAHYAALRIGVDPGVDALKTPSAALEFLSSALALPRPVCQAILDFLRRIIDLQQ
jgi:hypothetical protein